MDFPLQEGDTGVTAQISPCVGGHVRTWTDDGKSRLWADPDAEWLSAAQGIGEIGRTQRQENRFREAAWLSDESGLLLVQPRFPSQIEGEEEQFEVAANVVQLEPASPPADLPVEELHNLLLRAIRDGITSREYLVVEKGGWDAPDEPYCLFRLASDGDDLASVIETAPTPHGAKIWEPHIRSDRDVQGLMAVATPEIVEAAPRIMIDAISTWGLTPWDLALTFGPY